MKTFSIYGNCQSAALAQVLSKNKSFEKMYNYTGLQAVQTISQEKVFLVKEIFENVDLLLHQVISDQFAIADLSTSKMMKTRKNDSKSFTFPSLYFNAYFPHLDTFKGKQSILNFVHDYVIMYGYVQGLSEQQILNLIQDENMYSKQLSTSLLKKSLLFLKNRENSFDIKISSFKRWGQTPFRE